MALLASRQSLVLASPPIANVGVPASMRIGYHFIHAIDVAKKTGSYIFDYLYQPPADARLINRLLPTGDTAMH